LIKKLVANARAIISYQVGLPRGCQKMRTIVYWLRPYEALEFPGFDRYTKATRDLLTSSERLHCSREALRRYDERLVAINREYREEVLDTCFDIIDPYIFMEIAGQHDRSGADLALIREAVDYRQKIVLTDSELEAGLERLSLARLIRKRGNKYFVAPSIVTSLPRTTAGQISFRRGDWDRLRKSLFEA
jgi:hypothetical protein